MGTDAEDFDLGAEGEASASPDVLARLRKELQEMLDLAAGIEQLEEDLKAAKKTYQALRTSRIPDLMGEIQSDHFTHDGWDFKLTDFVSGSLPKDPEKRKKALEYLEAHDGAGLIKTNVSMEFGKSQHNEALSVAAGLEKDGHPVSVESGVHAQTLISFGRKRMRDGDDIDFELLGLYAGKVAKAKRVKS